jgi:hypothetical protein
MIAPSQQCCNQSWMVVSTRSSYVCTTLGVPYFHVYYIPMLKELDRILYHYIPSLKKLPEKNDGGF